MKLIIRIVFISFFSQLIFCQNNKNYIDEFGNLFKQVEIQHLKNVKKYTTKNNKVLLKYTDKIKGKIDSLTKNKIIHFLEESTKNKILKEKIIIINAGIIEGNCNIQNMKYYKEYKARVQNLKSVYYFEVISRKKKKYKNQIIDKSLIVFNSFFNYYSWNIPKIEKCGGTLIIFPDNNFVRISGDGNSYKIFDLLE